MPAKHAEAVAFDVNLRWAVIRRRHFAAADPRTAGTAHILDPAILAQQLPVSTVTGIPRDDRSLAVRVESPDGVVELFSLQDAGASTGAVGRVEGLLTRLGSDEPERFELDGLSARLLLAVQEGLACFSTAVGIVGIDYPRPLDPLLQSLLDLREQVLAGLEIPAGYQQLAALFARTGRSELDAEASPAQLNALALMEMSKWRARRGGDLSGGRVDLERLAKAAGRRSEEIYGLHVLRLGQAELAFEVDADLAFGWARLVDQTGQLQSRPFAFSGAVLERFAWASAAYDVAREHTPTAITEYLLNALLNPWFETELAASSIVDELAQLTDGMQGQDQERLREVLRRVP